MTTTHVTLLCRGPMLAGWRGVAWPPSSIACSVTSGVHASRSPWLVFVHASHTNPCPFINMYAKFHPPVRDFPCRTGKIACALRLIELFVRAASGRSMLEWPQLYAPTRINTSAHTNTLVPIAHMRFEWAIMRTQYSICLCSVCLWSEDCDANATMISAWVCVCGLQQPRSVADKHTLARTRITVGVCVCVCSNLLRGINSY